MKKTTVILYSSVLFLLFSAFSVGQPTKNAVSPPQENSIQWLTWEAAMLQMKVEKKKIMVDLYTDWCGWCKRMDQTTFQDPEIINYINNNYYPVKFNGEQKESITLGEKTYEFIETTQTKGSKGYHELAKSLSMGRLSYPTFVFLNEEGNILQPIAGYKDVPTFEMIMTYFGDDFYKSKPWDLYQKEYTPLKQREVVSQDE